ncbi:hypoxanthine-guanine phosphoribosyltransferase [Zooshikella marina]|uniref:Hypoxanthine-guanine phosphoribosyltransferase n=1 Tax=Zooshikella ganghwensis TaxID=202772 RepID=A0A4P9VKG0_9GAMM|nr:hypoxanthine-guanine phosphoribosyltransferase [Zooshikella ganghwensis]MBU2707526.1 hypoxanthine-guanine phosphoribosyltransferase [Zooshikella ganghwensis]RDH42767.1 hypoxanthine-guanine phosphoribosyltransferase [Zooshikella ganghwensis]
MSADLEHIKQVYAEADCLYTEAEVEAAIERMGQAITAELANSNPLVYCIMNGGLVVSGKLLTKLNFPLEVDYIHATRYRNETTGGELDWKVHPSTSMQDRTVLILDDILDEGHTLAAIVEFCKAQGAKAVQTAVLVEKKHDRKAVELESDFIGLQIEDRYIFGYGMDYKSYWRNAPGIFALKGH